MNNKINIEIIRGQMKEERINSKVINMLLGKNNKNFENSSILNNNNNESIPRHGFLQRNSNFEKNFAFSDNMPIFLEYKILKETMTNNKIGKKLYNNSNSIKNENKKRIYKYIIEKLFPKKMMNGNLMS